MKIISHHFKFRFAQLFRVWNWEPKMGLTYLILTLIIIFVKLPNNEYYHAIFLLPIITFHFQRKDFFFLKKIFINNWRLILFVEYSLLYTLFLLINIHYKVNGYSLLPFLVLILLIFITPKSTKHIYYLNFIPNNYFEWKSYVRNNFWLCVLLYLLMLASTYHKSTLTFGLFFFYGIIGGIFQPNENKEMLSMFFQKISLRQKIYQNLRLLNILLLPIVIVFLFLNLEDFYYALYYLVFYNLFLILIITRKYKIYHHKKKENYFDGGTSILYFLLTATVIPALFIARENYKDANKTIKNYVGN